MKIQLQHALVMILGVVACAAAAAQSGTQPFTLTVEAAESSVKAGSEVKVDITLRNSSNRAMYISYDLSEVDYAFEVRDTQNKVPPETEFARKSKARPYVSNDQIFYLQPGESLPKDPLILTKFYDMSRPGKYTVQVTRVVPKELGSGIVRSNTITINVTK